MRILSFSFLRTALWLPLALVAMGALAQVEPLQVRDAWARATVPGQGGTAAFMTLQAGKDLQLVGAGSPAAGVVQIHEMALDGDTMRMRPVEAIALAAHQSVALTPSGHHIMLMDLKQPLTAGSSIAITLQLRDAAGASLTQTVQVPVRQNAPHGDASENSHGAHGHHGS